MVFSLICRLHTEPYMSGIRQPPLKMNVNNNRSISRVVIITAGRMSLQSAGFIGQTLFAARREDTDALKSL